MTPKQKRFCTEYLIDCNGTQAAIRAGYSKNGARQTADKLMSNTVIREYIDQKLNSMESDKIADAAEVMTYLTSVMRGEHDDPYVVLCGDGVQEITHSDVPAKDRIRAAELLGKRYGLFTDRQQVSVQVPVFEGDDELED